MIPARAPLNGFSPGRPGLSPSSAPAPASHAPPASPRTKIHPGAAFSVVFAENAARTRECSRSRRRSRSAPVPAVSPAAGSPEASRPSLRRGYFGLGDGGGLAPSRSPSSRPSAEQTGPIGSSAKPVRLTRRVRPAISAGGTTARGWGQAGGPLGAGALQPKSHAHLKRHDGSVHLART